MKRRCNTRRGVFHSPLSIQSSYMVPDCHQPPASAKLICCSLPVHATVADSGELVASCCCVPSTALLTSTAGTATMKGVPRATAIANDTVVTTLRAAGPRPNIIASTCLLACRQLGYFEHWVPMAATSLTRTSKTFSKSWKPHET
jgi:hypothetical protein